MKYQKGTTEWKEMHFEECKEDILALEGNPFVRDMAEIVQLANEAKMDTGVGRDIYIQKYYPTKELKETIQEEWIREHKELCRKYYPDFIVEVQEEMNAEQDAAKDAVPFGEEQ